MLKAKVLIPFYDTVAKVNRKNGDVFDVTPARFNEITRKGRYIEAYEGSAPVEDPKEKK